MVGSLLIRYRKLQLGNCGFETGARNVEGITTEASGDDDEEDDTNNAKKETDMQINEDSESTDTQRESTDTQRESTDTQPAQIVGQKLCELDNITNSCVTEECKTIPDDSEESLKDIGEQRDTVDDSKSTMSVDEVEVDSNKQDNNVTEESKDEVVNGDLEGKENLKTSYENLKMSKDIANDIERKVKCELKEAVEIRVPKLKSKKEISEYKWMASIHGNSINGNSIHGNSNKHPVERSETPPLQKLMRQDFSPLKSNHVSPSPPKKMKENSSGKEGYTSKLASVLEPEVSLPLRTASHPKQLLSHSIASLRSSSLKHLAQSKSHVSHNPYSSKPFSSSKPHVQNHALDDQPLDLSKKSSKGHKTSSTTQMDTNHKSTKSSHFSKRENGMLSTSLQSLQQKFGGDFHLRGLRKPANYMLFGPELPALHQALLHSATLPLPHNPFTMMNGIPKIKPEHSPSSRQQNSTPSPSQKIKSEDNAVKSVKREETVVEKSMKHEKSEKSDKLEAAEMSSTGMSEDQNEKYTNHMCTCGKWFDSLYSLSLHLQETGHLPARGKSVSLLEYPKLVRGQDMWLNQESEQTRRILRCIQCGESFKTLPMLTVHMMKTQHYTKIVSSEHARRAHKCSAYCDKEQDKECVFKCKVCQDTFSDMEGLANHMIMSGHHKKQASRAPPTFGELQMRQKRKRFYSFEESLNPFGNPAVAAAFIDYKRKCMAERTSPDLSVDNDSDDTDSTISCENCGKRIETKLFVDHVRACLGQRLAEEVYRKDREKLLREMKERSDSRSRDYYNDRDGETGSPVKRRKIDQMSPPAVKTESIYSEMEGERNYQSPKSENGFINDLTHTSDRDDPKSPQKTNQISMQSLESPKLEHSENEDSEKDTASNPEKENSINEEIQTCERSKSSLADNSKIAPKIEDIKKEIDTDVKDESSIADAVKTSAEVMPKNLDIIDPNLTTDDAAGSSALSAMESFIQKSFSNKLDYKKGNIIIGPHTSGDASIHSRPLASAMNMDTLDYLSKYKKFYSALTLHNGYDSYGMERNKHKDEGKTGCKIKREKDAKVNSISPKSPCDGDHDDGRTSVKSSQSDSSSVLDKNENLEKKYLNMSECDENKSGGKGGKSSALDSLSSFVYGQPMTSEHPLDSLQRLITKDDIPKLMATQGARAFKYLPAHMAAELPVPLNLSVKSQNGDSDEEMERFNPDDETLSDYEAACSPANSDGDAVEYRCAACSRRFASKGSYRYHLSRCHLSSVKRYGIKEAFNMSPYIYLPLDHTAKFSKYYEMAKELANKRK